MATKERDLSIHDVLRQTRVNMSRSLQILDTVHSGFLMTEWNVRLSLAHIKISERLLNSSGMAVTTFAIPPDRSDCRAEPDNPTLRRLLDGV